MAIDEHEEINFRKFKTIRRRSVSISAESLSKPDTCGNRSSLRSSLSLRSKI